MKIKLIKSNLDLDILCTHRQLHVGYSARSLIMDLELRQTRPSSILVASSQTRLLRGSWRGVRFKVQICPALVSRSVQLYQLKSDTDLHWSTNAKLAACTGLPLSNTSHLSYFLPLFNPLLCSLILTSPSVQDKHCNSFLHSPFLSSLFASFPSPSPLLSLSMAPYVSHAEARALSIVGGRLPRIQAQRSTVLML